MPNESTLARMSRKIAEAEENFEAEKRSLFACTTDQALIEAGRVHLKDMEQKLADMHEMRVCLARVEVSESDR